ncbi:MAG: hypothetical protein IPJ84_19950 [Bdellovibrionales bacterium]|nr:hypothetical protein [Bdellovibrionales bacterium]
MDLLAGYRTPSGRDLGFSYTFDKELLQVNRADGKSVRYVYQANQKRHLEQIQTEAQNISIAYKTSMPLIQNLQTSDGSTVFFQYQGHLPTAKIYSGPFSAGIGLFYDPNGRLLSSLNVAGSAINIAYNTDREPAAVGQLSISREQQTGLVTGLQLSSISESFGYSLYGELSSKSVSGFGGESYARDSLGRITQRTIAASLINETSNYTYDPAGRLSRVVRTGPFAGDVRYTYDSRGNRILDQSKWGDHVGNI